MAYFLVMGGMILSLGVLIGWPLWRALRWLGGKLGAARSGQRSQRRSAARQSRSRRSAPAKERKTPQSATARRQSTSRQATPPSGPWWLTRLLAPLAATWPLALVAALLYGGTRLAEYGMSARPHAAPPAYHRLVEVLGWGTAALIGITLLGLLASWRCQRV